MKKSGFHELSNPVVVDFPLAGEWWAVNSPGTKIPSHGTDMLGQRYAYDFIMVDWDNKKKPYISSQLQYLIAGMPLQKWYGWGQNIYAPKDGIIIDVKDGLKERKRLHILSDMFVALKNGLSFNPDKSDLHSVVGNYIVMQIDNNVFAYLVHFKTDSICVKKGQQVNTGDLLGQVGHSGNSTMPHLHFHIMDSADPRIGNGIPCAFRQYERCTNNKWEEVNNGIPTSEERIRGII